MGREKPRRDHGKSNSDLTEVIVAGPLRQPMSVERACMTFTMVLVIASLE